MTGVAVLGSLQQLHKHTHTVLHTHSLTQQKNKQLPPPTHSPSIHSLFLPLWLDWSLSCGLAYCPLCQSGRRGKKKGRRGWNASRQDQAQCWSYLICLKLLIWSANTPSRLNQQNHSQTECDLSIHPSIHLFMIIVADGFANVGVQTRLTTLAN